MIWNYLRLTADTPAERAQLKNNKYPEDGEIVWGFDILTHRIIPCTSKQVRVTAAKPKKKRNAKDSAYAHEDHPRAQTSIVAWAYMVPPPMPEKYLLKSFGTYFPKLGTPEYWDKMHQELRAIDPGTNLSHDPTHQWDELHKQLQSMDANTPSMRQTRDALLLLIDASKSGLAPTPRMKAPTQRSKKISKTPRKR